MSKNLFHCTCGTSARATAPGRSPVGRAGEVVDQIRAGHLAHEGHQETTALAAWKVRRQQGMGFDYHLPQRDGSRLIVLGGGL